MDNEFRSHATINDIKAANYNEGKLPLCMGFCVCVCVCMHGMQLNPLQYLTFTSNHHNLQNYELDSPYKWYRVVR